MSFEGQTSRLRASLSRWIDLAVLVVVACSIYFPLRLIFGHYISDAAGIVGLFPWPARWAAYSFVFAAIWWPVVRFGGFSRGNLTAFFWYPPIWLACLFGICLVWFVCLHISGFLFSQTPHVSPISLLFAFGTAATGAAIAKGSQELFKELGSERVRCGTEKNFEPKPISEDIEALLRWIGKESPILTPDQDRLNTNLFACRIAEVVMESPSKTVSLVGGYGAGKSSIVNMTRHYLNDSKGSGVIPVEVCAWGFQRGSAAESILKQVVLGCSLHFDCLSLSNLPAQYSAAIGSLSMWGKVVSALLSLPHDPMEILRRVDRILLTVNKRLLVFIEDLDRNWQGDELWTDVISLLDRLKRLQRVSFVLAITETSKMGDIINRISDHVEIIPKLSVKDVAVIYQMFKEHCLARSEDIKFPTNDDQFATRIDAENIEQRNQIARLLNVRVKEEIDEITAIVDNPRNLKHILRRTAKAWSSLHGEIDFDDLFVANVLRVAALEAFTFIHENLPDIHWLRQEGKREDKEKERQVLHDKLIKACSYSGPKLEATEQLIRILFPYWLGSRLPSRGVIQGVSEPEPTNYWDRLIREKLNVQEISDQETARAISTWKQDHELLVYKGLRLAPAVNEIPGFAKKVKQFGDLIDGEQVLSLVSQLFEYVYQVKHEIDRDFVGRGELHYVAEQKEFAAGDWLVREVGKLLPLSLWVAVETYKFWFHAVVNMDEKQRIQNAMLESCKSQYSDRSVFVKAIQGDPDNAILELLITLTHEIYGGPGSLYDDWKWLVDLLLECAATHHVSVVPKILELAVHLDAPPKRQWVLSVKFLESFFGDKTPDLMILLSQLDLTQLSKKESEKAACAREEAAKWILNKTTRTTVPTEAGVGVEEQPNDTES
jgi:hypothetical protein